jgi:hypothetical protein
MGYEELRERARGREVWGGRRVAIEEQSCALVEFEKGISAEPIVVTDWSPSVTNGGNVPA